MIGIEGAAGEYAAQRLRVCPGIDFGHHFTFRVIDCVARPREFAAEITTLYEPAGRLDPPDSNPFPLPRSVKCRFPGRMPVTDNEATGSDAVVTVKLIDDPKTALMELLLVNVGAASTASVNCCVATPTEFFAVRLSE